MLGAVAFWLTGLTLAALLLPVTKRGAGWATIATAAMLPPVFLLATLWSTDGFGDFRLRLTEVTVAQSVLSNPFRVGGDAATDDLVFRGLPPGLARLGRAGDGRPQWSVDVTAQEPSDGNGAVEVVDSDGQRHIVGSRDLLSGDILCLARCGGPDALSLRVRADGLGMENVGGMSEDLPPFKLRPLNRLLWFPLLEGLRSWTPTQGIFPLRDYGSPWFGVSADAQSPCRRRFLCQSDGHTPIRSFVYYDEDSSGLRVMLLDPGARLLRGGTEIARTPEQPIPLNPQLSIIGVRFFAVSFGSPFIDPFHADRPTSRLDLRGAINQSTDVGIVRLSLRRPAVVPIERPDIEAARRALAAGDATIAISIVGAARGAGEDVVQNPLRVEAIGGALGRAINARLLLDQDSDFGRFGNSFELAGQTTPIRLGELFPIGNVPPAAEAVFMLERLDAPWLMVAAAFLWAVLLALTQRTRWRESRTSLLIIAVVQWLLALRLLIGFESAALNPQLSLADAGGANMLAYFVVPLLLAAATPGDRASRRLLRPALLFCWCMWGGTWWLYGWTVGQSLGLIALLGVEALCAPSKSIEWVRQHRWSWLAGGAMSLIFLWWFQGIVAVILTALLFILVLTAWSYRRWLHERPVKAWLLVLSIAIIARLGLLLLGFGERIGWSINVSIIYVPMMVLTASGLLFCARGIEDHWQAFTRGFAWCVLLLVGLIGVPVVVGDRGAAIYAIPVLIMGVVVTFSMLATIRRSWFLGWSVAPTILLAIAIAWVGWQAYQDRDWNRRLAAAIEDSRSVEPGIRDRASATAATLLAEANEDRMDKLRIWTAFAPDRVANAGTSEAESQRRVVAILSSYTERLGGHGYMARSDPHEIRNYQADDNLSAVHVMGPFGRLGAVVLLLVLGLLAWAGDRAAAENDWLTLAGRLALWTIFATATYMILANLQLLPFTGRNLYLLAALSKSDLLEGSVLMLIALRGLARPT